MKEKDYKKREIVFGILIFIWFFAGVWIVGRMAQSLLIALVTAVFLGIGIILIYIQYRLDDWFISSVVIDLTKLCDKILLHKTLVFPENEDTLASKFQEKIMKLAIVLQENQKKAEENQANMKTLVSDIAHQLKTPLSNLAMYVEFLEDDQLTFEDQKKYQEVVKHSVERLTFLSEKMIKVSRLESGLLTMKHEKGNLNEAILKAIKDCYMKATEKNMEITYVEHDEVVLLYDKRWTSEAIFNVIDNAIKYAEAGTKIVVELQKYGMFAGITITDQAKPIKESEKNKIFERFYRGRNSNLTEGVGLGLYITREIIIEQGGYINVKTLENGNQFLLFFQMM